MPTKGRTWKVEGRRQYSGRSKIDASKEERRKNVFALFQEHKTMGAIAQELGLDRGTVSGDLKFMASQGSIKASEIKENALLTRRAKWIKAIQYIIDDALPYFNGQNITPSLRNIYS